MMPKTIAFVVGAPVPIRLRKATATTAKPDHHVTPQASTSTTRLTRRNLLRISVAVAASTLLQRTKARAATKAASHTALELGEKIINKEYGYAFSPPASGWTKNVATLSSGRVATILLRDADGDSNISMVSTPVSSDFQKLSSFGTMENVVTTIIPPTQNDIEGNLITSEVDVAKNAYVFEYTVTSRGVRRHLVTVFSLQPGRCLLTLTGQSKEDEWPQVETTLRAVANSFEINLMD